jgi:hypothetical protein
MKKLCLAALVTVLTLTLFFGCRGDYGDHRGHPVTWTAQILSDQGADGDIAFTSPSTYVISSAATTLNVLAGVDPLSSDEFRGFLDFPLGGSAGVPLDATIVSATLQIEINSVAVTVAGDTVPMILDLVDFQPPSLRSSDFDRSIQPPLLSEPFVFFTSDAGSNVAIDVTPLMQEVQRRGLPDFQVRLLLDFSAASGLIEIDDNAAVTAPVLTVQYN